jgi:hypothetical protein
LSRAGGLRTYTEGENSIKKIKMVKGRTHETELALRWTDSELADSLDDDEDEEADGDSALCTIGVSNECGVHIHAIVAHGW